MPDHPQVLVATLGGQPQIVTVTLDLLLQRGFPISEVMVLHPRASTRLRPSQALLRLQAEFPGGAYPESQRPLHFHSYTLELDGKPIDDIVDDTHADGTLDTIRRLLGNLKRQGYRIHLSVGRGCRLTALLAPSVASNHHDQIWHLYTPEAIQEQVDEGRITHIPPDAGITPIRSPFLPLRAYIYHPDHSFRLIQEKERARMDVQERTHCAKVRGKATVAQLKVLQAFARRLRPRQVADALYIATVAVNTHKTVLLNHCHRAWNIPEDGRMTYHFLATNSASIIRLPPDVQTLPRANTRKTSEVFQ